MRELMISSNCIMIGLQGKSFKKFSNDFYCFFCLFILFSELLRFCLLGWNWSIDLLVRYIRSVFIQFFGLFFRTSPIFFILSCNFILIACVTSFLLLMPSVFLQLKAFELYWGAVQCFARFRHHEF